MLRPVNLLCSAPARPGLLCKGIRELFTLENTGCADLACMTGKGAILILIPICWTYSTRISIAAMEWRSNDTRQRIVEEIAGKYTSGLLRAWSTMPLRMWANTCSGLTCSAAS